jgi:hypothetical protein
VTYTVTFENPIDAGDVPQLEWVYIDEPEFLAPPPLPNDLPFDIEYISKLWEQRRKAKQCRHARLQDGFSSYYCLDCPAKLRRNYDGELEVVP